MKSRRLLALLLVLTLCMGMMTGCGGSKQGSSSVGSSTASDDEDDPEFNLGEGDGVSGGSNGTEVPGNSGGSGNSGNSGNTNDSGGSGTASNSPAAPSSGKSITVWDFESNTSLLAAVIAYEKATGHKVIVKDHAKTTVNDLKMAMMAGTAPDICNIDNVYLAPCAENGYIREIDTYGAKSNADKFTKVCWDVTQYGGKTYGMPFDANTLILAYNKKMMTDANAKVPTTYAEFIDACAALKAKYPGKYAYTFPTSNGSTDAVSAFVYFFWLWGFGGDVLKDNNTKAAFNSSEGIKALEAYIDFVKKGYAPSSYQENNFMNGDNVGMVYFGCWGFNVIYQGNRRGAYDIATLPVLKTGVPGYSGVGTYCYSVTASSKNPDIAYDFIKYYTMSSAYQLQYCKSKNFVPTLKEAQKDSFYTSAEWQVVLKQIESAKARPSVKNWDKVEAAVSEAISAALKGGLTATAALDNAAKKVDGYLK